MAGYVGKYKGSFKRGAKGKDCAAVKRTLKRIQKNERIKHTQNFGGEAEKALKVFQKNHDLRPDGIYGPVTHRKLAPMMRGYEIWLYKRAPVRQSAIATWVVMGPNADRKGVATKGVVKDFVSKVAHEFGAPVIITTGTNHNQYVAGTDHQSQHWTGDAADVGMYGSNLTKLGQAALRAAGMPAAQAFFCRGGVYNVGGKNILFNTNVGGNHYNHCHMGV